MPAPNKLAKADFEGMDPHFQRWLSQLTDTVNTLVGYNGPIVLKDHIDLGGNQIKNVGKPTDPSDAISSGHASSLYSAEPMRTQMEASGPYPFRTYRSLNNPYQRDNTSAVFMNLMGVAPTANDFVPSIVLSGSSVEVNIPDGKFLWAHGFVRSTTGRTDLFSLPAKYPIGSIDAVDGVVTVNTAVTSLAMGDQFTVWGVDPPEFNGIYPVLSANNPGSQIKYQLHVASLSGSGGFVSRNRVYYYYLTRPPQGVPPFVNLSTVYTGDTLRNRFDVCHDGSKIVGVVNIGGNGADIMCSGAGGSPIEANPGAGGYF